MAARLHGRVILPWARQAADLIGEWTYDDRGRVTYRYPVVVVNVPRQCSKTTFALDLFIGRALQVPGYRAAYTAQTGHATSARFYERFDAIARHPIGRKARTRRSAGTERLTLPGGSYVKAFPPISGSLRGDALDLVLMDEAQEHDDELGTALDHTILPVFTTRPRRQLVLLGTAGESPTGYLWRYLEAARAGAPGVALIEYGADDDDDPGDPAVWARTHPGMAGGLTDAAYLASVHALDPAAFRREYLNVWPRTASSVALDPDAWTACADELQTAAPRGRAVFAVDSNYDRTRTAVAAAWQDGPLLRAGIVWTGPTHKARAAVQEHAAVWRPRAVRYDPLTSGSIALPAWESVTVRDVAAATDLVLQRVRAGTVRYRPHAELQAAATAATLRPIGDGGQAFRRTGNAAAPLLALSLALLAADRLPATRAAIRGAGV